ncbi:class I SAM-dependent methyltransferase [Chloroflexota bacterium]
MKTEAENELHELVTKWTSFMKWRSDYEEWIKNRLWQELFQAAHINGLKELIGELSGKKVLDLGCGMGGFSVALTQRGVTVIALDCNPDYCKITRLRGERYGLKVSPINGVGEYLPLRSEQFDMVVLSDVLEHVQNPHKVLKEVYRVLKSRGSTYVTVVNKFTFNDPHYHLRFINWLPQKIAEWYIEKRKRSKSYAPFKDRQRLSEMHYFTFREFTNLARTAGFYIKDPNWDKLNNPSTIISHRLRSYAICLKTLRLTKIAYTITPILYYLLQSSFTLVLMKSPKQISE